MKLNSIAAVAVAAWALGFAAEASAQIATQRISLAQAERMTAAARQAAADQNLDMVVVVVDIGGTPISLERMDGVQLGSVEIAQGKARTSALLRRSTAVLEDAANDGRASLATLFPGITLVQGALPVMSSEGEVIGAIGCSGGTSQQDEDVCSAGLAAFQR